VAAACADDSAVRARIGRHRDDRPSAGDSPL